MLRLNLNELRELQRFAADRDVETCAAGLLFHAGSAGSESIVVRELREVPDEAYSERTHVSATLRPSFCTQLANAAKKANAGILLAHTHVGTQALRGFSCTDDRGEVPLASYFEARLPGQPLLASVVTAHSIHVRKLAGEQISKVVLVGSDLVGTDSDFAALGETYDRQVRAFGADGQARLSSLRIAIVGLGGTGSVVAQQIAYLGVRNFVLIDPDLVEISNLNRLVGANKPDVGQEKVETAARQIQRINTQAKCVAVRGDIIDDSVAGELLSADFIFCCTDSMASRAVLNQIAYQYFIPCIDMGVGIGVHEGCVEYIAGRVQMLSPGLPCLVCTGKLDYEQVRREMLTEEQRKADPYVTGAAVTQPAVISLNSTISSAAVTMFLSAVTGIPSRPRMLSYDGKLGTMRAVAMEPRTNCVTCSQALGRGKSWKLPTRQGR